MNMKNKISHYLWKSRVIFGVHCANRPVIDFLGGFLYIIQGICNIITLGIYRSSFVENFYGWKIHTRCKLYSAKVIGIE